MVFAARYLCGKMDLMEVSSEEAIILAIWAILGLLVGFFIYQTVRKDRRAHYLTLGLLMAWLGVSTWAFRPFLRAFDVIHTNVPVIANGLFYPLAYYAIYLHYELIYRYRPRLERLAIMSAMLGSAIVTSFLIFVTPRGTTHLIVMTFFNDIYHDFIRLFAFSFAVYVTHRTWLLTREREPAFELTGLTFILLGTFPTILGNYTDFDQLFGLSAYEWGDLLTFLGLTIIIAIFIYKVDYLYRMPVALYHLLVFNSAGIAILSMAIKNRKFEVDPTTAQLISGPITAITSLFEEVFQRQPEIEYIKARNQAFLFESTKGLTAMIIGERPTYFVKLSLRLFLNSIPDEVLPLLNRPYIRLEDESIKNQLLKAFHHAFPYVEI